MDRGGFLTINCVGLITLLLPGCGAVSLGNGGTQLAPNAPISATGIFPTNANSVTGTIAIYHLGTGSYEAFLSALSAPTTSGSLFISVVNSSGTQVLYTALTSYTGTQGYPFSSTEGTTFTLLSLKPNPTTVLAQATLTSTGN